MAHLLGRYDQQQIVEGESATRSDAVHHLLNGQFRFDRIDKGVPFGHVLGAGVRKVSFILALKHLRAIMLPNIRPVVISRLVQAIVIDAARQNTVQFKYQVLFSYVNV